MFVTFRLFAPLPPLPPPLPSNPPATPLTAVAPALTAAFPREFPFASWSAPVRAALRPGPPPFSAYSCNRPTDSSIRPRTDPRARPASALARSPASDLRRSIGEPELALLAVLSVIDITSLACGQTASPIRHRNWADGQGACFRYSRAHGSAEADRIRGRLARGAAGVQNHAERPARFRRDRGRIRSGRATSQDERWLQISRPLGQGTGRQALAPGNGDRGRRPWYRL